MNYPVSGLMYFTKKYTFSATIFYVPTPYLLTTPTPTYSKYGRKKKKTINFLRCKNWFQKNTIN